MACVTHGVLADKGAAYKPVAQLLQDLLPPVTHALLLVTDSLALRTPADASRRSSDSEAERASRPSIIEVSLSQRGARAPTVTLQQLLQPRGALDSHSAALLGQVTAGSVREPLRRLVRAAGSKAFVPLVPLFAVIAGWRKHLSQFPAAAPLNAELKEVHLSCFLSRAACRACHTCRPREHQCHTSQTTPVLAPLFPSLTGAFHEHTGLGPVSDRSCCEHSAPRLPARRGASCFRAQRHVPFQLIHHSNLLGTALTLTRILWKCRYGG